MLQIIDINAHDYSKANFAFCNVSFLNIPMYQQCSVAGIFVH